MLWEWFGSLDLKLVLREQGVRRWIFNGKQLACNLPFRHRFLQNLGILFRATLYDWNSAVK